MSSISVLTLKRIDFAAAIAWGCKVGAMHGSDVSHVQTLITPVASVPSRSAVTSVVETSPGIVL